MSEIDTTALFKFFGLIKRTNLPLIDKLVALADGRDKSKIFTHYTMVFS